MKKVLLVIMMIGIVGFGCVPTAAPATPATNPVQELQTWRTGMDTWKVTVADPAIAKINAQVAGANYQPQIDALKTTLTTKDTAITDLTTRLTALENWKATVGATSVATTGSSTIGTSGQTVQFTPGTPPGVVPTSAGGGVIQQVNFVQGTTQTYTSPSGTSNNIWYVQRLINQSTAIQYVRPTISLSVSSQYGASQQTYLAGINLNISSSQGTVQGVYIPPTWWNGSTPATSGVPISSITATSGLVSTASLAFGVPVGTPFTFSLAPGLGQLTNSVYIIPTSGLGNGQGEYYISPGGFVDATVMIQGIYTSQAVMFNISPSFSSHP